jgi:pyruvate carboxylase subunit B
MKYFVTVGGREMEVEVDGERVTVGGRTVTATLESIPGTPVRHLVLDGRSLALPVEGEGRGQWAITLHGERHGVEVVDERARHVRSLTASKERSGGGSALKAPMPGLVVRLQVAVGDRVAAGASVVVLEAMKMENQLKSPGAGVVAEIRVAAGQAVEKGQLLVVFAEPDPT